DAALLEDGRVVTADRDGLVRIVGMGGSVARRLSGHRGPVWRVLVLGGARLVTAGADRSVRLWDLGDRRPPTVLGGHPAPVTGRAAPPPAPSPPPPSAAAPPHR